jgi:hypothetical protein
MRNLSLSLLFLFSIAILGCKKSNEEKAKDAIRTYLNENLDDMSSYEAVKFGTLDTVFVFDGQRVLINNPNNSFRIVQNEEKELGFFDYREHNVIVFDSLRHNLLFVNSRMVLYDNQNIVFYDISTRKTEKLKKLKISNLPKLKHKNIVINFSKLDPNQFEMLHSYRLKDEKDAKYLTKKYFILNSNLEVISNNDFSYKSLEQQGIVIDTAATAPLR